jgi:hypothetical protein
MYEGGYVCIEIALQIPPSPHPHEPSSFNTNRRDSEAQPVISEDPPPIVRGVVTARWRWLFLPVYSGSWICMQKFNSETHRRELNAPMIPESTNYETTTYA